MSKTKVDKGSYDIFPLDSFQVYLKCVDNLESNWDIIYSDKNNGKNETPLSTIHKISTGKYKDFQSRKEQVCIKIKNRDYHFEKMCYNQTNPKAWQNFIMLYYDKQMFLDKIINIFRKELINKLLKNKNNNLIDFESM